MALIEGEMPLNKIGKLVKEDPHRIWTIFNFWIGKAYSEDKILSVNKLGLDETSQRKGHNYITVAVDLDSKRVLHVTEGKNKEAVKQIKTYLEKKNVDSSKITQTSIDLSVSFISPLFQQRCRL